MTAKELRDLGAEELSQKEKDLREELFNLRFQHSTSQLEKTSRISQVKKDLARVKTIQREIQKSQNQAA